MTQLDEQLFSSPGSVQEEFTKESLKERIMFFEANKAAAEAVGTSVQGQSATSPVDKFSDADCSHQSRNSTVRIEIVSEEENPFASSELESFSSTDEEEDLNRNTPSEIIRKFERELVGQKTDDIETKPLEKHVKGVVFRSNCQLPSSFEMVNNFRKSGARPGFLRCASTLEPIRKINSKNLYSCSELVFSQAHLSSLKSMFRSPGSIVNERPKLHLCNSIITENGTFYYIRVCSMASSWYLLKGLANPELELTTVSENDNELSMFVVSDVATTLFKRSNYLLFNGLKVIGRFVGQSLCVCINDKCIKALRAKHVEKRMKTKLLVDGLEFELSCEIERDEWFESVKRLNLC